ncbi:MAG: SDR family oxidoreductase [Cyclobacteriaceae bacterium]
MNNADKIILITGASSGIGKACFDYLTNLGHEVYGTSRNESDNEHMLQVDVTDRTSIDKTIAQILEAHNRLDVLVNNAGISLVGSIEDTSVEEAKNIMETNFWGAFNMCQAVLPTFRQQQSGLIINISSVLGLFAIPYQSLYVASKFALEGLTESLRMEMKSFNVKACLIEPGDFRTEISEHRITTNQAKEDGAHKADFDKVHQLIINNERKGDKVIRIAKLVEKIIHKRNPKVRYTIGKPLDVLATKLKSILPQKLFELMIMDHYKL